MPLVALDLDGTLVDQAAAARLWAQAFVETWALPVEQGDRIGEALAARRPKDEVFDELVAVLSLPMPSKELWASYRARMPELVRCSDADRTGLKRLRAAGWTLGLVTNGMVDNQEGKIQRTGLADLVDGWVISEEIGARKPDPAIFRALAARLDCPLVGWMVGDSLEMDVAGGNQVGLKTVWITSASPPPPSTIAPTATAATVADAVDEILARGPAAGSPRRPACPWRS